MYMIDIWLKKNKVQKKLTTMERNQPDLYSFYFKTKGQILDKDRKLVSANNIFQWRTRRFFIDWLVSNFDLLTKEYPNVFGDIEENNFLEDFIVLKSPQKNFMSWLSDDKHFLFVNFIVPTSEDTKKSFTDCFSKEIRMISALCKFLRFGALYFLQSDVGKYYAKPLLPAQRILPTLTVEGGYYLDLAVQHELRRNLGSLLYDSAKCVEAQQEATVAVNSILNLANRKDLESSTNVSLHRDYIQIQIFGDGCALIIDFSGQDNPDEVWRLVGKHTDNSLQVTALLAAAGTLFRLAEDN